MKDKRFDGGYFGKLIEQPKHLETHPIKPINIDELRESLFAYLREHCDSERGLYDNPAGRRVYPFFSRMMNCDQFIMTTRDLIMTFSFSAPMATHDAHHCLELIWLIEDPSTAKLNLQIQLYFRLGQAVERFDIRRRGVEKLAAAKTTPPPASEQFTDAEIEAAFDRATRTIVGSRKRSERIRRTAESIGCSVATVKRRLKKLGK